MRGAKLPIAFVVAVVAALIAGALGLVAFTGGANRDNAEPAAQTERSTQKPTGSSTAAAPPPSPHRPSSHWPGAGSPWPDASPSAPARSASSAPAARGTPMTVSYSVAGPASATVLTYWQGDHDIASEHGTALPWSRTVTLTEQGLIRLSAQVDNGAVRCSIAVDGQIVAAATADYFVSCETRPAPAEHDR